MSIVKTSLSLATTAALVALAGAAPASAAGDKDAKTVHCYGVNSCKGQSACKTAHNACQGQNACKGHGFKEMTEKQCAAAGGSLTEPK